MTEGPGVGPLPVSGGMIVDESLFGLLVDFEIQKARRLRYSISLVYFDMKPESGGNGEPTVRESLAERVTRHLRSTDAVAVSSRGWVSLLLIDAETTHLPSILQRMTARLSGWSAGGSCYPGTAMRAEDMQTQAVESLIRAKETGGNRLYVAS